METFMKSALIVIIALGFSGAALADGFVCHEHNDGAYVVEVYNNTNPSRGTRSAAIMILSDNTIQYGRQTIAVLDGANGHLRNDSDRYVSRVDLRFKNSRRQGENLFGTKLGQVDTIVLDVAFSYGTPLKDGDELPGRVTIFKRDGQRIFADMNCYRYLKN